MWQPTQASGSRNPVAGTGGITGGNTRSLRLSDWNTYQSTPQERACQNP
jgi:hypothetical protein